MRRMHTRAAVLFRHPPSLAQPRPERRTFLGFAVNLAAALDVGKVVDVGDLALRHGARGARLEARCKSRVLAVLELADARLQVGHLQRAC